MNYYSIFFCTNSYVANYLLHIITLYRFEVFVGGSIHSVQNNQSVVHPVLNGWTSEHVNRRPAGSMSGPVQITVVLLLLLA